MQRLAAQLRTEVPKNNLRFGELLRPVHEVMTEAADNEFLTSVMDRIHALSRRFWYAHRKELTDIEHAAGLHATRLEYIVARDMDRATEASDKIVAHVRNYVLEILGAPEKQ